MFIPTTKRELEQLGWETLDVILVTGDSYVDSSFIGASVVGHVLMDAGYRVGIIAQPDTRSDKDITRLDEPRLFWGVTGGCVDSMVANYTATKRPKRADDLSPGGKNDRRPDRAVIVYANLLRRYFKGTCPIVLGGVEASLRRMAHYDYWSDSVRRSILFDAKADLLVYGMAESTVLELAGRLRDGRSPDDLRGVCYIASEKSAQMVELPSYEEVTRDKQAFTDAFHAFYRNSDPLTAQTLCQRQDTRYLVQNPPAPYLSQPELDAVYELDYERAQHPYYECLGPAKALETIRSSLTSHRGCYGECNFCSIAVHQGRTVRWRSADSLVREAERLSQHPDFRGIIQDVGGPTANMYGYECQKKLARGACEDKRCIYPEVCSQMTVDHGVQLSLLRRLRKVAGVRKVFVASGVRPDLVMADEEHGPSYLREVVAHHISGQMKVAPEHIEDHVLLQMGKPGGKGLLLRFRDLFNKLTKAEGKRQFLTYYFIAAHPGCTERDMQALKRFASRHLQISPRQVQIFTPTPSTYSTLMYHTEMDPFSGAPLYVEKGLKGKARQKRALTGE